MSKTDVLVISVCLVPRIEPGTYYMMNKWICVRKKEDPSRSISILWVLPPFPKCILTFLLLSHVLLTQRLPTSLFTPLFLLGSFFIFPGSLLPLLSLATNWHRLQCQFSWGRLNFHSVKHTCYICRRWENTKRERTWFLCPLNKHNLTNSLLKVKIPFEILIQARFKKKNPKEHQITREPGADGLIRKDLRMGNLRDYWEGKRTKLLDKENPN